MGGIEGIRLKVNGRSIKTISDALLWYAMATSEEIRHESGTLARCALYQLGDDEARQLVTAKWDKLYAKENPDPLDKPIEVFGPKKPSSDDHLGVVTDDPDSTKEDPETAFVDSLLDESPNFVDEALGV